MTWECRIAGVAVVGVSDDEYGQRLAAYVVPRSVDFVAELPHTSTGKVAKAELGLLPRSSTRARRP